MSPISPLSVLAFASTAVAVPFHGHHNNYHSHSSYNQPRAYSFTYAQPSGSSQVAPISGTGTGALFPYLSANATAIYPTGSGIPTGYGSGIPSNYAPSPVGPATESISSLSDHGSAASSSSSCASDVTITSTVQVTVTVTADESPSSSAVEVSPTAGSKSHTHVQSTIMVTATLTVPAFSAPSYSAQASTSSEAAPISNSSSSSAYTAPASSESALLSYGNIPLTYSAAASSSSAEVSPVASSTSSAISTAQTLTYSEVNKGVVATSTSSFAPAATGTKGKRGLAYNDASLTNCFVDSNHISWAYNWGSSTSGLSNGVSYIPMLWGPTSSFTNSWSNNAKAAIKAGATHLMGFNEPDLSAQSNLTPEAAAKAWRTYMQPFAGGSTKLVAPSVTNGGGTMGLTWLAEFLSACSDCQIDAVNIHWYDSASNTDYFKSHMQNATDISGGKPVFLSEFGAKGSDHEISTFLQDVMPWMDSKDFVHGYAYFMVSNGLLNSGSEPSSIGATYKSYTA